MFSAQQLAKFAGSRRISQETFDAAVRENIEEFEMEPEEALSSAVEEFTAQGVDLSNIIKTLAGGDISSHPAAQAVQRAEKAARGADPEGAAAAADDVAAALAAANSKDTAAEVAAVLHKAGAAGVLVQFMPACAGAPAQELRILNAVAVLLGSSRELQADFLQAHGVAALQQVLGEASEDASLAAAALQAAAAVAAKNEEGKAALMAAGLGGSSLEAMQRHADQPEVLQAACDVLCALTNPDDDTQPASRAFPNARALAKEGAAKQLVAALRGHDAHPQPVVTALSNALKQVAANDEICQEVAASGGVELALRILEAGMSDASTARPLCALLRQLVSSDSNKELFVECGGLELLATLFGVQGSSPAVLEQALGLLTNVTLRYPEAAARASACGCLDATLELMHVMLASNGTSSVNGNGKENRATAVQRQACMAIRNAAVRSPEVRASLLDKGAEALLRQVKSAYPSCAEAGAAALRDLGLEKYN
ncbi:hypothetical protein COHA_005569 [Chlorella ohadii]|uniref:Armadillo repeat-containing protein 6 n=1 Tax=Chlorella ohadii TaxID=2649997 RepID=A0AAD5H5A7_9CHLO|nr:hypothetical protein COHA_005569 [Chlorella ohadii]